MFDVLMWIVLLMVIEGGYYVDVVMGGFDVGYFDIVYDFENFVIFCIVFGVMIVVLVNCCVFGFGLFIVMCCDNLQGNGDVLC